MKYQLKLESKINSELETLLHLEIDADFKVAYKAKGHDKYWGVENVPNYCFDHSETMPLAFDYGINFTQITKNKSMNYWKCLALKYDTNGCARDPIKVFDINPLRAAVITLLLMKKDAE